MTRKKDDPIPHWKALVSVYFSFCLQHFHEEPSFDGGDPRHMKFIIKALMKRASKNNVSWTETYATLAWKNFLTEAYKDEWLSKNFLLKNINGQKDKIFFNKGMKKTVVNKSSHSDVPSSDVYDVMN